MKKLIAIVISFIFVFEGIGYCLRVPMEFWGGQRVTNWDEIAISREELKRKTPWQIARESKGRLIPIFISEDHSKTYWAIECGIKEGFLDPGNTIVLNFDAHNDTLDDGQSSPFYNNWLRVVKEHGMIEEGIWINSDAIKSLVNGKWEQGEFVPPRNLKGKDIVISICMDYFDNPERLRRLEECMEELIDFMKSHREHIRLVTIAYSERWCHYIMSSKEIADNDLCKRLNATIVSVKDLEGNIRRKAAIGDVYIFEKQGVIELGRALPDTADFLKSRRGNATQI